jgi:hypothetical protein
MDDKTAVTLKLTMSFYVNSLDADKVKKELHKELEDLKRVFSKSSKVDALTFQGEVI